MSTAKHHIRRAVGDNFAMFKPYDSRTITTDILLTIRLMQKGGSLLKKPLYVYFATLFEIGVPYHKQHVGHSRRSYAKD